MEPLLTCFPPVVTADTRLLLCGSLPGAASLAAGRYYAHPRNQFWQLIGAVIDADLAARDYDERLSALQQAGVGLWDVVAQGRRTGSLDTAIRDAQASPLAALTATLPALRAVAFNGGTAARIGRKALGADFARPIVALPSSSPAYTLSLADKMEAWRALRAFL